MKCTKKVHYTKLKWSFNLFYLGQYLLVLDDVFIGCQQDIELPTAELRYKPTAQSRGALLSEGHKEKTASYREAITMSWETDMKTSFFSYLVSNFDHRGCPLVKFIDPVGQSPGKGKSMTITTKCWRTVKRWSEFRAILNTRLAKTWREEARATPTLKRQSSLKCLSSRFRHNLLDKHHMKKKSLHW